MTPCLQSGTKWGFIWCTVVLSYLPHVKTGTWRNRPPRIEHKPSVNLDRYPPTPLWHHRGLVSRTVRLSTVAEKWAREVQVGHFPFMWSSLTRQRLCVWIRWSSCVWFTDPCGRQCEGMSHPPVSSVPPTSTEAPRPPPARTRVESADLQKCFLKLCKQNSGFSFPPAAKEGHELHLNRAD